MVAPGQMTGHHTRIISLSGWIRTLNYTISLDAGIRSGSGPPSAYTSDGIPLPEQILNTAAISLNYHPAPFSAGDLSVTAAQPLPALFPPDLLEDTLDVSVSYISPAPVPVPGSLALVFPCGAVLLVVSPEVV